MLAFRDGMCLYVLVRATGFNLYPPPFPRLGCFLIVALYIFNQLFLTLFLPLSSELMSVTELAKGIRYTEPLHTSWRPPRRVERLPSSYHERVRKEYHIVVEGEGE